MARTKRNFTRPEGNRDAKLIVIATEGRQTESIYFEGLSLFLSNPKVHVKVIEKLDDNSSPDEVLNQLKLFEEEYNLDEADELWMVIDRDYQSWKPKMIKQVAQICHQKKGYYLALSNPAFELWLLLHFIDCTNLSADEKNKIFENKKIKGKSSKTYNKKLLSDTVNGFNASKYDPCKFAQNYKIAIKNAIKLDSQPRTRWPDYLATRVHKLVQSISKK
jgi:hypothetical protein